MHVRVEEMLSHVAAPECDVVGPVLVSVGVHVAPAEIVVVKGFRGDFGHGGCVAPLRGAAGWFAHGGMWEKVRGGIEWVG